MPGKGYNPHKALLENIKNIKQGQHINKAVRDEPKRNQNEFELLKRPAVDSGPQVGVKDLLKVLKTSANHVKVGKQISNAHKNKKPLSRPLEKTERSAIHRKIAYDTIKKRLKRWDAYVAHSRSAETQVFPLANESVYVNTSNEKPFRTALKSDLMLELESTENKLEVLNGSDAKKGDQPNLLANNDDTREELLERKKKLAYLRMRESQQSAKARQRNKIKSLKYRQLLRRQKVQDELKRFELLKKANPALALERLNEFEKARIIERASLRHKNTGSWAKNLQVRAKFDKEARRDLHEQLLSSRQLTQKVNKEDESISDVEQEDKITEKDESFDAFNPWLKNKTTTIHDSENAFENENWRKYWLTRNENENLLKQYKESLTDDVTVKTGIKLENAVDMPPTSKRKALKSVKNQKEKVKTESEWIVEKIKPTAKSASEAIDTLFDAQEDKINKILTKKLERMSKKTVQPKSNRINDAKETKSKKKQSNLENLSFKNKTKKTAIDEELNYDKNASDTKAASEPANASGQLDTETETPAEIDPNKIFNVRSSRNTNLKSANDTIELGDNNGDGMDDDVSNEHRLTIYEAFEDDEVIADFVKDNEQQSNPIDVEIQLSMPGWGSWGGAGITYNPAKNKRILFKKPAKEKRKIENSEFVHINEKVGKSLKEHLVSDVPFPFTSTEDFNASIRAPIGRNTVPETAFRMLTRPSITTRKGQAIKPVSETELLKATRKHRNRR